jgi:hypothetical protein
MIKDNAIYGGKGFDSVKWAHAGVKNQTPAGFGAWMNSDIGRSQFSVSDVRSVEREILEDYSSIVNALDADTVSGLKISGERASDIIQYIRLSFVLMTYWQSQAIKDKFPFRVSDGNPLGEWHAFAKWAMEQKGWGSTGSREKQYEFEGETHFYRRPPTAAMNNVGTNVLAMLIFRNYLFSKLAVNKHRRRASSVKKLSPVGALTLAVRLIKAINYSEGGNVDKTASWSFMYHSSGRRKYMDKLKILLRSSILKVGMTNSSVASHIIGWGPDALGLRYVLTDIRINTQSYIKYSTWSSDNAAALKRNDNDVVTGVHAGDPGHINFQDMYASTSLTTTSHVYKRCIRDSGVSLTNAVGTQALSCMLARDRDEDYYLEGDPTWGISKDKVEVVDACCELKRIVFTDHKSESMDGMSRIVQMKYENVTSIHDGIRLSTEKGVEGPFGLQAVEATIISKNGEASDIINNGFNAHQVHFEATYGAGKGSGEVKTVIGFPNCGYHPSEDGVQLNLDECALFNEPSKARKDVRKRLTADENVLMSVLFKSNNDWVNEFSSLVPWRSNRNGGDYDTQSKPYIKTVVSSVSKTQKPVLSIVPARLKNLSQQWVESGRSETTSLVDYIASLNTAISISKTQKSSELARDTLYSNSVGLSMVPREHNGKIYVPTVINGVVGEKLVDRSNIVFAGYCIDDIIVNPVLRSRVIRSISERQLPAGINQPYNDLQGRLTDLLKRITCGSGENAYPRIRYSGWNLQTLIPAILRVYKDKSHEGDTTGGTEWLQSHAEHCKAHVFVVLLSDTQVTSELDKLLKDAAQENIEITDLQRFTLLDNILYRNFGMLRQKTWDNVELYDEASVGHLQLDSLPLAFYWILLAYSLSSTRVSLSPKEVNRMKKEGKLGYNLNSSGFSLRNESDSKSFKQNFNVLHNSRRNAKSLIMGQRLGMGYSEVTRDTKQQVTGVQIFRTRFIDYIVTGRQRKSDTGSTQHLFDKISAGKSGPWTTFKRLVLQSKGDSTPIVGERDKFMKSTQGSQVLSMPRIICAHKNAHKLMALGGMNASSSLGAMGLQCDLIHIIGEKGVNVFGIQHAVVEAAMRMCDQRKSTQYNFSETGYTALCANGGTSTQVSINPQGRFSSVFSKWAPVGRPGILATVRKGDGGAKGAIKTKQIVRPMRNHLSIEQ